MTTWIEELCLKRSSQATNVYLVETLDFLRLDQIRKIVRTGEFGKLVHKDFAGFVEHDIQRMTIRELPIDPERLNYDGTEMQVDPMGPYVQLDRMLRSNPTVCFVKYVILPGHAEALSNVIVPWSHDQRMYGHKSTVVVFTASLSLFNDNVRRLCYQISIPPSSPEERSKILGEVAEGLAKVLKVKVDFDARQVEASSGLTLHDVETAALEGYYRHRRFDVGTFTDYKVRILRNYGIEWVEPTRGFESVGGYDYLKDYVRHRVIKVLTNPETAQKYGLTVPRGLLLFGPPGTGKTYFSKAIAKESNMPMLKITPADFLRGIVGETEARVKQLTTLIETMTPCIVFVDEFDQLSLRRDAQFIGDSGVSRRMQNMLLDWLGDEARRSFIIAATNFIDLDPAFIRPGRIDEIILVLPPDAEAREQILKVHVAMRKTPVGDVDFAQTAKMTHMWSGAELERLVKEASALAMDQEAPNVTQDHFARAYRSFEVNTEERYKNITGMISRLKALEQVNQHLLKHALDAFAQTEEAVDSRVRGLIEALTPGAVAV